MIDPATLDWDSLQAETDAAHEQARKLIVRRMRRASTVPHQLAAVYGLLHATAEAFMATKAGDVPASLMAATFLEACQEVADQVVEQAQAAGLGGTGGRG